MVFWGLTCDFVGFFEGGLGDEEGPGLTPRFVFWFFAGQSPALPTPKVTATATMKANTGISPLRRQKAPPSVEMTFCEVRERQ